jgi:putative DNA primase/helicase
VPVYDVDNVLHGLQYISADGTKMFESGTATKGHFSYIVGDKSKPLHVCEGFATAASINEATDSAVIIAFSCGNLKPVAEAIWARVGGNSCD